MGAELSWAERALRWVGDALFVAPVRAGKDASDGINRNEPAVNTAAQITLAAPGSGYAWAIIGYLAYYDAAPAAGQIMTFENPSGTTVFRDIAAGALTPTKGAFPLLFSANTAVVITLPAGGAAVTGKLYVVAQKERVVTV